MKESKGRCPVSFLWRGDGVGRHLIIAGLVGFLLAIFIKTIVVVTILPHFSIKNLMTISAIFWLVGKILCAVKLVAIGAQKRTRTSTKSNFTRT